MASRRLLLIFIAALVLLLAACSAPPQEPSMSSSQAGASIDELLQAGRTVTSAPGWSALSVPAISAVSAAPLPVAATAGDLPRGEYVYDLALDVWDFVGASDDLSLSWEYDLENYRLLFDWNANAPTVLLNDQFDNQFEAPTGAEVSFTKAGVEEGAVTLGSGWTTNQCGYDEPTSGSLSAYFGDDDAKLELSRLDLALTQTAGTDTLSAGFGASATVGADSLSVNLDLSASGQLSRAADCTIDDLTVESGSVAAGLSTRVDGHDRSFAFYSEYNNLQYDSGALAGVDLDGYLRLDGALALAFAGTLNDANHNGVPGDELQLTFAESQTMTLEEFLIEQVGLVPLTAMRMMLR